jgi:hypothetical protein
MYQMAMPTSQRAIAIEPNIKNEFARYGVK